MAEEPKQTTPKGYEIPVPTRDAVESVLERAAQPVAKPKKRRTRTK